MLHRTAHRDVGSAQNIERINSAGGDNRGGRNNVGSGEQVVEKVLALGLGHRLGVVEVLVSKRLGKGDGGRYNGAGERAAAGFVNTDDSGIAPAACDRLNFVK